MLTPAKAAELEALFNSINPADLTRGITDIQLQLISLAADKTQAYRGAAKDKDESERSVRSSAMKALNSKIEDYAQKGNEAGEADTPEADVVMQAEVETELLVLQNSFVDITVTSIDKEHRTIRKGQTHGERRGEKKALPSKERVEDAATKEFKNAKAILNRGLKALERPLKKSKDSDSVVK